MNGREKKSKTRSRMENMELFLLMRGENVSRQENLTMMALGRIWAENNEEAWVHRQGGILVIKHRLKIVASDEVWNNELESWVSACKRSTDLDGDCEDCGVGADLLRRQTVRMEVKAA
jgi:hypothetical protein